MQVRIVPVEDKLEVRVKGPNVTPGYFKAPELTAKLFDEAGWLKTGDAVRFADPANPAAGLLFDGRVAENFKLLSGTWVNVGTLRTAVIAAGAPVIEDAVVTGHDRDEIGLLIFPSLAGLRGLCPQLGAEAKLEELVGRPKCARRCCRGSRAPQRAGTRQLHAHRALLAHDRAAVDRCQRDHRQGLSQPARRAGQARALVERLHAEPPPPDVIVIG